MHTDTGSSPGSLWKTFDQDLIMDQLLHAGEVQGTLTHLEDFLDAHAVRPLPPQIQHLKGAFIGWGGWFRRLVLLPAIAIYLPLQASNYLDWAVSHAVFVALGVWAAVCFLPSLYHRGVLSARYGIIASDVFYDFRRSLKPLLRKITPNASSRGHEERVKLGRRAALQVVSFQRRLDSSKPTSRYISEVGSTGMLSTRGRPQNLASNSAYRPDFAQEAQKSARVPVAYQMFAEGTDPYEYLQGASWGGLLEDLKFDLILYYIGGLVAGLYTDFSYFTILFIFAPIVALLCTCGVRFRKVFYFYNIWLTGLKGQDPSGASFSIKSSGLLRAYRRELRPIVVAFRKGRATAQDLDVAYTVFRNRYPLIIKPWTKAG